jgi:hypothetical protein
MGKKDKKSKTAEQKARVAAKQSKKATQKEKKATSKGADDSDAEDIDLESVLEEYAKQVSCPYYFLLKWLQAAYILGSKHNFSRSQKRLVSLHPRVRQQHS